MTDALWSRGQLIELLDELGDIRLLAEQLDVSSTAAALALFAEVFPGQPFGDRQLLVSEDIFDGTPG